MDREYQVAGLRGPVECYPKNGDCVIVDCVLCRIAELEAAARNAVEYMRLSSPHPSQAMLLLELLLPETLGEEE